MAASSSSSAKWVTPARWWFHPAPVGMADTTGVYVRLKTTTTTTWLDGNRGNLISDSEGSFFFDHSVAPLQMQFFGNFIRHGFGRAPLHRPSLRPARKRVSEKCWSEAGIQRTFFFFSSSFRESALLLFTKDAASLWSRPALSHTPEILLHRQGRFSFFSPS